jgi:hypothetical protein
LLLAYDRRRTVRTVLLITVLAAAGGIGSLAAPPPPSDVAGVYSCAGTNPDGTPYEGVVEIARVRDTYRVRWTLEDGSIIGVGIFSNGVLAVSYFGGAPAVAVYRIEGERLVGEWTMGGVEGTMYRETLTKMSDAPAQRVPVEPAPRKPVAPTSHGGAGTQI